MTRAALLSLCALMCASSVHAEDVSGDLTCASCDPQQWIDLARAEMGRALYWDLQQGETPASTPARLSVLATSRADRAEDEDALRYAKAAAATCLLSGDDGCRSTMVLLADLTLSVGAGDPEKETEALAYLSLVDFDALPPSICAEALVLRYRLSEMHTPRLADPKWADSCGAMGRVGEVGYRAAKAAIIRGNWDDAAVRLDRLRVFGHGYHVRASYFAAVLAVARNQPNRASRLFEDIIFLAPDRYRTEEEDDARILAALQLARLHRMEGRYVEAIETYRRIPSKSAPRADAILESAVVAAHLGNLNTARAYLDALAELDPAAAERLEVRRLRANLAVIDGDEEDALVTFRELAALGKRKRHEIFETGAPPEEKLKEDPTLGGLLEGQSAGKVATMERELDLAEKSLIETETHLTDLMAIVKKRGRMGPLETAIERLEEADAMLRRAEGTISLRQTQGTRLAGPARPALSAARAAARLRRELDRNLSRLRANKAAQDGRVTAQLTAIETETSNARTALLAAKADGASTFSGARKALVARADELVERLEMSEDVGFMELAWRKKREAELEVKRVRKDFEESKASLVSDNAEGSF